MNILVIDVGGTHVKIVASGESEKREIESGPTMTARQMVSSVVYPKDDIEKKNGRLHDIMLYNGADRTGRWSGQGVQPHNYVEQLSWLFFLKAFDESESPRFSL